VQRKYNLNSCDDNEYGESAGIKPAWSSE